MPYIIASLAVVILALIALAAVLVVKIGKPQDKGASKEDMTAYFKAIAGDILQAQTKMQDENLQKILSPLKEQMNAYKKSIDDVTQSHKHAQGQMSEQLRSLFDLNKTLSKEAQDLTNALKGNKKIQGNWGEIQLEKILELSGLRKGIDYKTQETFKTEEGMKRPDTVVQLPNERQIVIDSKVSMMAYLDYLRAEDAVEKQTAMKAYQTAIENHIKSLSSKEYQKYLKENALDYVFMFIPLEQAFVELLSYAPNLYETASKNNIALVTPSSLFPLLRVIEQLWQTERQGKNVMAIADLGGKMYDKLSGFLDDMQKVEKGLDAASKSYKEASKKLSEGKGNLVSMAEKMKELGAKTSKQLENRSGDEEMEP